MSDSRPPLSLGGLREAVELAGLRQAVGPIGDLAWTVPPAITLEVTSPRSSQIARQDLLSGSGLWNKGAEPKTERQPGEGHLVWRGPRDAPEQPRVRPVTGLLLRFAALSTAEPETFREFGSRWGPLGVCEHGLPGTHIPSQWYPEYPGHPGCPRMNLAEPSESIEVWRNYAMQAAAVIQIVAALRDRRPSAKHLWAPVRALPLDEPLEANIYWVEDYEDGELGAMPPEGEIVDSQRDGLAGWINWWLAYAGAGPRYDWRRGGLVTMATGGLFGALAYQLAMLEAGDTFIANCSMCGEVVERTRKPQVGRRVYCDDPDCRERGRRRVSARKIAEEANRES